MRLLNKIAAAFDGAVDHFIHFFHYINADSGFYHSTTVWAVYIFIITSILLMLVMFIARPRDVLEVSLAIRQGLLALIFASPIVARWEGWRIPQWYAILLLISVSITGVLVIYEIVKEYFWSYWDERRSE